MRKFTAILCLVIAVSLRVVCSPTSAGVRMPANAPTDVQLAIRLLQSNEPEDRAQAAGWIGSYGVEAKPAVPYLIKLLADPSKVGPSALGSPYGPSSPRYEALGALELLGKVALPDLLRALKDTNKDVPFSVVQRLGSMFQAKSENEAEISARYSVAGVLGQMKCKAAVRPLLNALKSSDAVMPKIAATALISVGTDEAIDGAISCLKDCDRWVRNDAARRLGEIREPRAVEPLINLLNDEEDQVISSAIYALGEIGDKRAIEPLKKLMGHNRWFIRSYAADVLVKLGDRSQCEALARELKSDRPQVDAFTAEAISKANDPSVIDAALAAIKEGRNIVLAEKALKKAKDPRIVQVLSGLLSSNDSEVFLTAAEYLGASKDPSAVDALIPSLESPDMVRRGRTAYYLGECGDKRAVPALIKALSQTKGWERSNILDALAEIGVGVEGQDALISELKDEDAGNRGVAAGMLGQIKTGQSVAALTGALKDSNPGVRSKAAESLGLIGGDTAIDALIAELMDPNSRIRPDAVAALGGTGSVRAAEYLKAALKDNSDAVKRQAATALDARKNPGVAPVPTHWPRMPRYGPPAMFFYLGDRSMYISSDIRSGKELIKALSDSDAAARIHAIQVLRFRKDKSAVEPLIKAMQTDKSTQVRQDAIYALMMIDAPRAIPPMLVILKTEPKPDVELKPIITADRATLLAVVDLLDHPDKDVATFAVASLHSMTLQNFGTDKQKWSEWVAKNVGWKANEDRFSSFPRIP